MHTGGTETERRPWAILEIKGVNLHVKRASEKDSKFYLLTGVALPMDFPRLEISVFNLGFLER